MTDKERREMLDRIAKEIESGDSVRKKVEECHWKYGQPLSAEVLHRPFHVF